MVFFLSHENKMYLYFCSFCRTCSVMHIKVFRICLWIIFFHWQKWRCHSRSLYSFHVLWWNDVLLTLFPAGRQRAGCQRWGWPAVPLDPTLLLPAAQRPGAGRKGFCYPLSYIWKRPTSSAQSHVQSGGWGGSSTVPRSAWSQGEVESCMSWDIHTTVSVKEWKTYFVF